MDQDVMEVKISKAGKDVIYKFSKAELNAAFDAVPGLLEAIIVAGMEKYLNSRMTKGISAPSKLTGDEFEENKEAALKRADENFKDLCAGKLIKGKAVKASVEDRKVMSEALRLAKVVVKNELRKAKITLSHVPAKEVTEWAKKFVAEDPSYIEQAKANLAETEKVTSPISGIATLVKLDPKKVAKTEADKAKRQEQLSAKQAGLPKKAKAGGKVPPRKQLPPMTAAEALAQHHSVN